jgi:hypothetical protein
MRGVLLLLIIAGSVAAAAPEPPPVSTVSEGIANVLIPVTGIIFGTMLPILGVLFIFILSSIAIKNQMKRHENLHEERMMALEKGLPLPEIYRPEFQAKKFFIGNLHAGIICLTIGLGTAIALGIVAGPEHAVWGGIIFVLGVGFIISAFIIRRIVDKETNGNGK